MAKDDLDQELKRQQEDAAKRQEEIRKEQVDEEDEYVGQTEADVRQNAIASANNPKSIRFEGDWVDLIAEEVIKYQQTNQLLGYDPKTMKGIVRPEPKKNETPIQVQKQDDEKNRASLEKQGVIPVQLVPANSFTENKGKAKGGK